MQKRCICFEEKAESQALSWTTSTARREALLENLERYFNLLLF